MGFEERLGWMLLGCGIGFVLGYLVRTVRDLKGELDEVDGLVKRKLGDRATDHAEPTDAGLVRYPLLLDVALVFVLALCVWASFASQKASNDAEEVQKAQGVFVSCNTEYLSKTIRALNERTTYATEQARSNIELQRAQAEFVSVLLKDPPVPINARREALERYFDALNNFIAITSKVADKAETNPYPTNEDLRECLNVP